MSNFDTVRFWLDNRRVTGTVVNRERLGDTVLTVLLADGTTVERFARSVEFV